MSVTGLPGQGPLRVGVPIADLAAGLYLAIGILVALHERERTGEGRWVQTSLLEAMVAMLDFQAARWTMDGEVPGQEGNHHPTVIPMGCFATADGHVNIARPRRRLWRQLLPGHRARPSCSTTPATPTVALRSANAGRAERHDRGACCAERTDGRVGRGAQRGGRARRPGQHDRRGLRRPPGRATSGWRAPVDHPAPRRARIVRNAVTLSRHAARRCAGPPRTPASTPTRCSAELGLSETEIGRPSPTGGGVDRPSTPARRRMLAARRGRHRLDDLQQPGPPQRHVDGHDWRPCPPSCEAFQAPTTTSGSWW